MKWYENSYRRHLLDMHIEDWDERFLSEFSPETYVENLKLAKVKSAMIYLQSHVGHCYWPTKTGHMHKALIGREDMMKRVVDLCHENDIDVIAYYSIIYNNDAHDEHPQWRIVQANGRSRRDAEGFRYGHCCPNHPQYRQFVLDQIREMAEYFDFEGMFYDMPFFPYPCYCDSCRSRWQTECGGELPEDPGDCRWQLFEDKRKQWIREFSMLIADEVKRLKPGVSVELNYANAVHGLAHIEDVNEACDYVGGDLTSGSLVQSFTCKYYYGITNNQPFEYMTVRGEPSLKSHTITKSRDKLLQSAMVTCAHHGANLFIDAIDPVGTMNQKFYELLGEIYQRQIAYEPYLTGRMVENVGVFFSLRSNSNLQGQSHNNHSGSRNAVLNMIRSHIPVGVVASGKKLKQYPFVIFSNPSRLEEKTVDELIDYVARGGVLYFSNADEGRLMQELVGGSCQGYTASNRTYIAAKPAYRGLLQEFDEKYPLPMDCRLPLVTGVEEKYVAARMALPYTDPAEKKFASIHSNPPGDVTDYPALVIKPYGKGTVIWSAAPIENEGLLAYRTILENLVRHFIGDRIEISTTAPEMVELVTFEDQEKQVCYISAAALNDGDVAIPMPEFEIRVKTDRQITAVQLLPEEREIPFERQGDEIVFRTRPLHIFDMYRLLWR